MLRAVNGSTYTSTDETGIERFSRPNAM